VKPNQSIQRMGASRSDHLQFLCQRRLAPTADARRWPLCMCALASNVIGASG
jgi:hypothetical protein